MCNGAENRALVDGTCVEYSCFDRDPAEYRQNFPHELTSPSVSEYPNVRSAKGNFMGRKRTIDRDATMAAIESVVHKHGVGGLSIDAVAKEAGISKSSVVYDFKNKAGLLTAFTESRMNSHRLAIESLRDRLEGTDRWLRAALQNAIEGPTEEETAAAMMLCAAAGSTEECLTVMQQEVDYVVEQVNADAGNERLARIAFLALHGLKTMEYFNFRRFSIHERREILDDIASLLGSQPASASAQS